VSGNDVVEVRTPWRQPFRCRRKHVEIMSTPTLEELVALLVKEKLINLDAVQVIEVERVE